MPETPDMHYIARPSFVSSRVLQKPCDMFLSPSTSICRVVIAPKRQHTYVILVTPNQATHTGYRL